MKSSVPYLPKSILFLTVLILLLSGCSNNFKKITGKTYIYEDSLFTFTAGFDNDTLYYIIKDTQRPYFYRTKYKLNKINDSTFNILVEKKPKQWPKDTWDIIVTDGNGFKSAESKNYYRLYADSMLIKKAF
ncbi:MAG TPA: hypothetical protein PKD83_02160 [Ignavibacteria bacterium]|nr:hypothetical protein [Ignavibacteria bacterium]